MSAADDATMRCAALDVNDYFPCLWKKIRGGDFNCTQQSVMVSSNHEHVERLDRRLGRAACIRGEHRHICGLGAHDV